MGNQAPSGARRQALTAPFALAVASVAALTLMPRGSGWRWGAPIDELHWYLTGLGSEATMVQLVGNLTLLAAPAAVAVLRWPPVGKLGRLVGLALAAGTTIELLQRVLPLGRVVSPLDAVLNAVGAVAAGLLVQHVHGWMRSVPGGIPG